MKILEPFERAANSALSNRIKKITVILVTLSTAFILVGQGCGDNFTGDGKFGSNYDNLACSASGSDIIDKNFQVIPGESTVSIVYGRQLLDNYVSCTGLGAASARTLAEWERRNQSLSEYGSLTDISGAMMMAIAAVATEVCQDIIEKESALPLLNRAIFRNVNLGGTGLSGTEVDDTSQLLALSCWQRTMTAAEQTMIRDSILQMNANSTNGSLGLCTAMLASLSAIQQ